MNKLNKFTPYFFSLHSILFLWATNLEEVYLTEIILILAFFIVFTFLVEKTILFVTKNHTKTYIISSIFILMFFSYGRIFNDENKLCQTLNKLTCLGIKLFRQKFFLLIWILIFVIIFFYIVKSHKKFKSLLIFFTFVSLTLITINIYTLFSNLLATEKIDLNIPQIIKNKTQTVKYKPDIYYIILDAYGRNDVLKNLYHYDNNNFTQFLTQKGFFVAKKSFSNYPSTQTSIPSSLTSSYLKSYLNKRFSQYEHLATSPIIRFLKMHGYKFINISSGYSFTARNKLADLEIGVRPFALCNFSQELLFTTMLGPVFKYLNKFSLTDLWSEKHSKRIMFQFNTLKNIKNNSPKPQFVFCHIFSPHEPFIFEENGVIQDSIYDTNKERKQSYTRQLPIINREVKKIINNILDNSKSPPIIIIQSDHGPGLVDNGLTFSTKPSKTLVTARLACLNAIYLPEEGNKLLYDSITPVNTFRLILNYYFNADIDLLKDKHFWIKETKDNFKFIELSSSDFLNF
jgi:hypothetical protein